ncbi:hypothetical protein BKA93DRAFT_118541 [Sparassis latifolia]
MTVAGSESLRPGPAYISSRSADAILSDVRPIKLNAEALQSINVLLDELLYNILSAARSISTDRLKGALSKVLPTNLGKEALLEAEVELKAYWERSTAPPASARGEAETEFNLQWAFELLRLKCEAYSTMNDSDEDADAEKRLNAKMGTNNSSAPPKASLLAPAALYLTAILESTCEHLLSNVSRVAARDSSRTTAILQDVFIALCEDDSMYGMFKTMKVYDQIEVLSKAQKPRRSKSFSRSNEKVTLRSQTSSPFTEIASLRESSSTGRVRMSSESMKSGATTTVEGRTSLEKGRAMKKLMSHSRSSSEKEVEARAQSESGRSRASTEFEDDSDLLNEFDELMRSGATVKVSLTPDRLKSMEVYNKERAQRASRRGQPSPESKRGPHSLAGRPHLRHVDSIIEDEEEPARPNIPPTSYHTGAPLRVRQGSLSSTGASGTVHSTSANGRNRSISISNIPHPRYDDSLSRRTGSPVASAPPQRDMRKVDVFKSLPGQPQRTRRVMGNRESIDLEDVMAGSDNDTVGVVPQAATKPTSPRPKAKDPYVSQSARDLIDFLDEGPPEEPKFPHAISANASVISFESSKSKAGRFSRMMSKLTIGGSTEKLSGRYESQGMPRLPRTLGRKPSKSAMPPPPAYMQQSLSLSPKRSLPNVIVATPPRPPPPPSPMLSTAPSIVVPSVKVPSTLVLPIAAPSPVSSSPAVPSPVAASPMISSSASSSQTSIQEAGVSPVALSPRRSTMRKAVPTYDERTEIQPTLPVSPPSADESTQTLAQIANGQANGHVESTSVRHAEGGRDGTLAMAPVRKISSKRPLGLLNGHNRSPAAEQEEDNALRTSVLRSASENSPRNTQAPPTPVATDIPQDSAVVSQKSSPSISTAEVDDFRRLLSSATSVDECRLLVDMFFARNRFPFTSASRAAVSSSVGLPSDGAYTQLASAADLESSLVELFLGESGPEEDTNDTVVDVTGQVLLMPDAVAQAKIPSQCFVDTFESPAVEVLAPPPVAV